jgi:hypothetical protein
MKKSFDKHAAKHLVSSSYQDQRKEIEREREGKKQQPKGKLNPMFRDNGYNFD